MQHHWWLLSECRGALQIDIQDHAEEKQTATERGGATDQQRGRGEIKSSSDKLRGGD